MIIRYHVWWPSSNDPYYRYNISENSARANYYGVPSIGVPYLRIDGTVDGGSYSNFRTRIINESNISSPLNIQIEGNFDPATRNGQVQVTVMATDTITNTNLKLRIGVIESDIYWEAPNNTDWHHQTFRDLTPNANGIALTIQRNQVRRFTQDFSCPSPIVPENCEIFVFVQSDSGRRILQGNKKSVSSMFYTLEQFSLIAPLDLDSIQTSMPQFIWNASADPDSGFPINYEVILSRTPLFDPRSDIRSGLLPDTSWICDPALPNDTAFYWKVVATSEHAPLRTSREIWSFVVQDTGGCQYTPGDINGMPPANGIDVTYGVTYLKGGPVPPITCDMCPPNPPFYAAMDVNGSCSTNGLDVTYFVGFLKGGPGLIYCPACPPTDQ